ncbi:MAG: flagellin [Sphingomonas sp.]
MSMSVNTNVAALTALQSLNATANQMSMTQNRISTGLKVSSTKDDSASYTIAQTLRGDVGNLGAVSSSLSRAKSTVDVAVAGAQQISDLVNQMSAKATAASDSGLDQTSRDAMAKDFDALKTQIQSVIDSSSFNGTNLLAGSSNATADGAGADVHALTSTSTSASTLDVSNQDFDTSVITGIGSTFTDAATAKTMVDTLKTVSSAINTSLSTLGAASRQIDGQSSFVSNLTDVITSGIGNLVDADLSKESANLQALQVKQQLGVQALSIANQAPQMITRLFQ